MTHQHSRPPRHPCPLSPFPTPPSPCSRTWRTCSASRATTPSCSASTWALRSTLSAWWPSPPTSASSSQTRWSRPASGGWAGEFASFLPASLHRPPGCLAAVARLHVGTTWGVRPLWVRACRGHTGGPRPRWLHARPARGAGAEGLCSPGAMRRARPGRAPAGPGSPPPNWPTAAASQVTDTICSTIAAAGRPCRARKRVFLLDHDGTLVAQSSISSKPSQDVLRCGAGGAGRGWLERGMHEHKACALAGALPCKGLSWQAPPSGAAAPRLLQHVCAPSAVCPPLFYPHCACCACCARPRSVLSALTSDPRNVVYIISGRARQELADWFGSVVRRDAGGAGGFSCTRELGRWLVEGLKRGRDSGGQGRRTGQKAPARPLRGLRAERLRAELAARCAACLWRPVF